VFHWPLILGLTQVFRFHAQDGAEAVLKQLASSWDLIGLCLVCSRPRTAVKRKTPVIDINSEIEERFLYDCEDLVELVTGSANRARLSVDSSSRLGHCVH